MVLGDASLHTGRGGGEKGACIVPKTLASVRDSFSESPHPHPKDKLNFMAVTIAAPSGNIWLSHKPTY